MISFNNASLLTYSHVPKFFGDGIFNYSIEKNIQIQGYILDLENFDGVSGVLSGINDIKNLAKNSGEFVVNGHYLGTGYIKKIEVNGNPDNDPNWVRYANYVVDLLILSTGSLHDMTGIYYQDIDSNIFDVKNLYLVNDFRENLSINLDSNGIYDYKHSCEFNFENGIAKNIAISTAKALASGIISSEVPFNITDQFGANFLSGRKLYTESYDIVNNRFSFAENFAKSKSGDYADALYTYKLANNEDGSVNVIESVKIKSLSLPLFEKAIEKLSGIKSGSYSRCQNVYENYYLNSGSLNIHSVSQGINVNRFEGEIDCETTFTNDAFIESGYNWEFVYDVADNTERRAMNLTLSIQGHGPKNSQQKWNNAMMGFNAKNSLFNDISVKNSGYNALRSIDALYKCRPISMPYFLLAEQAESSYYEGLISCTKNYSDIDGSIFTTTSRQKSVPQYSVYTSANIKIDHPQKTLGKYSQTIQIFNPNLNLSMPSHSTISGPGLLEIASTTHKVQNNIVERKVSYYTHE